MKKALLLLIALSLMVLSGCATSGSVDQKKPEEEKTSYSGIGDSDNGKNEKSAAESSHSVEELALDSFTGSIGKQNKWAAIRHFRLDGIPVIGIGKAGGHSMPLLFFLHEQGGKKEDFIDLAVMYAELGYYCVLFDLPGYGEYVLPESIESIESAVLAADSIASLLDYYGTQPETDADRFALWGISMGGSAIYHYTAFGNKSPFAIVVACTSPDFSLIEDLGSVKNGKGSEAQWSESEFLRYIKEHNPIDHLKELLIPSVLSFNGLRDDVIPVEGSQKLEASFKENGKTDYTFIYDKQARHDMTPEFLDQAFGFMEKFVREK